MGSILRIAIALMPLTFTPVIVHLIASGQLDLGGGEKDLVVVLLWLLWSFFFAVTSIILWLRGWPVVRSNVWSAFAGLAGLLGLAVFLILVRQLGVGGALLAAVTIPTRLRGMARAGRVAINCWCGFSVGAQPGAWPI